MKKLITLTITFALVLISASFVCAKETSAEELATNAKKAAVKQRDIYTNSRVKQMCEEWPSCQEWVGLKSANTVAFQLVDTEVAHWISAWNGKEALWGHRFYAQTRENGQIKAYEFLRLTDKEGKNVKYLPPTEIKKFPGHPLPQEPSTHALVEDLSLLFPIEKICKAWPGCMDAIADIRNDNMINDFGIQRVIRTQYISKWDAQGNAYWTRGLFVKFTTGIISSKVLYFSAHQTNPGGAYTYESPKEVKRIPSVPSNFEVFVDIDTK